MEWTDLRSYKKLVPSLTLYPDHYVVTADDDILYERDWLESLTTAALMHPGEVICKRAHWVTTDGEGKVEEYGRWEMATDEQGPSKRLFPTTGAGVLYPPHCFDVRATDESLFMNLCPTADDLWFYWMALLSGKHFRRIGCNEKLVLCPGSQEVTLDKINNAGGENNVQMRRLISVFGEPAV